jgi:steroid delta-isomerase-like uncharacterized protein
VVDLLSSESLVRAFFGALNARDYARAAGAIAESCEWWSMPAESLHHGPAAIVAGLREFTTAFPDWRADIDRVTAAGPIVVAEWISTGTFLAPFRGRQPNGRAFRRRGCSVAEVQKGKIVHYRDYYDRASLLEQLALAEAPRP